MQTYCAALNQYKRLKTREVRIGNLLIGGDHPIRVQTMTTTDTMDTEATVAQTIRCIEAGAELVRITAPSKKEAENLAAIKALLHEKGYQVPLVADIHFTPNAAEVAARIIEKVRINPGNYIDKKKFEQIEYTDAEYQEEIDRIRERFTPLVLICKEHGTAMRIGTNHGSLSDRIMSRYGDTANGMVESAMEFLRIARSLDYHQIVLSMKSSNPQVMVQAYRLLVKTMMDEFAECYPLHLGVTEAGDGEDGRIKSAIGIGTLLEDGIGDTIRVSLTEDPEFEIPVCLDIVNRYRSRTSMEPAEPEIDSLPYSPFEYNRRSSRTCLQMGGQAVPVVVADYRHFQEGIQPADLFSAGYTYDALTDKWTLLDAAADFVYTGNRPVSFPLPGMLHVLCEAGVWAKTRYSQHFPVFDLQQFLNAVHRSDTLNVVCADAASEDWHATDSFLQDPTVVLCLYSASENAVQQIRLRIAELMRNRVFVPVIIQVSSSHATIDEQLIHFATGAGALFLDGMGDGIWLQNDPARIVQQRISGRTYLEMKDNQQFLNNTAFSILQAVRTRISKTEYISCPSCGRTLFDLQETTARIRSVTHHLKGVKIAIMGCIVNGPGEMADADFGYVGSGPGKITLYKGKEVVKRNIDSAIAVDELIALLKEHNAWVEKG